MEIFSDKYGRSVSFDLIEKNGVLTDSYRVVGLGAEFTLEWPHPWPRERALHSIEALAPAPQGE